KPSMGSPASNPYAPTPRACWIPAANTGVFENRLHYVRDVTFDEDRSRVRRGAGAQVMASIRNLALSILRLAGARYIPSALRCCARQGDPFVFRLIGVRL